MLVRYLMKLLQYIRGFFTSLSNVYVKLNVYGLFCNEKSHAASVYVIVNLRCTVLEINVDNNFL